MKINQILLCAAVLPIFALAQPTENASEKPKLPPEASESWYEKALKNIASSEYNIQYSEANCGLRGHNRKNNFYIDLPGSGFALTPKAEGESQVRFTVQGIFANGKKALRADIKGYEYKNHNNLVYWHRGFKEQYINTPEGLRQNFIIEENLYTDEIKVLLHVEGATATTEGNTQINLRTPKGTQLFYKDLRVWDANGHTLAAHMQVLPNNKIALVVSNTKNATYPITIDPLSSTAAAVLEVNQASANMGYSVASAGDVNNDGYSDVIVGAYNYDNGQTNEGRAYVYHGSTTGISSTAAAVVESNQAFANLGYSVASAGDVNNDGYSDVIIGAYNYSNGQTNEGRAYVHHGSSTGINATAATIVESNQTNAQMGYSVASAGDVNNDGYSDVIVGAYLYDNVESNEGAAFLYHGSISGISSTAAAVVESNQISANLGNSVASAGDVNNDGYSDVIVGANLYDNGISDEGVAFVYHGSASGISITAAALVESNQASANLGISVASAGDVNNDGYSDVCVGASFYSNGQDEEGAAFVYHGSATGISSTAAAMVESNQDFAEMGVSVSGAGDVNGDGFSDVIVGAHRYDNGESNEGAAYVYHGSSSGISTTAAALLEINQSSARMGVSVGSAGDVNNDGYNDVIVGASSFTNGQSSEGAAFVYHGTATGISKTAAAVVESNQVNAQMGYSVASAGDVNGDGYSDVIVGAYLYDNGETDEGAAFIYLGSSTGISTIASTLLESNQTGAQMGISVASAGDVNGDGFSDVIVGTYLYDNGQTDEGVAFVYHGSAIGISTTAAALVESNQTDSWFGISVACAGDVNGDGYSDVIVGAHWYSNGQTQEGRAYVYHGAATGINITAAAVVESNQLYGLLGRSVANAGDVNGDGYSDVIVGASFYDNGQSDEGTAFVYHGSSTGISTTPATLLESNQASASFGYSLASAGDVNGDGYSDVLVGAFLFDNGQTDEGAAFLYHGSASGISTTAAATIESNQTDAQMGISVSAAGDVNDDGYSDVIVGALLYDNGQTDEGAAFVYHGSAIGISTSPATVAESDQANAQMGISVASAGDVNGDGYSDMIVGAFLYNSPQADEGRAYVYHGAVSGISTTPTVVIEGNQIDARMGSSVASAGDVNGDGYSDVIIGAIFYENGQVVEGVAFVYHGSATGLSSTPATLLEENQENSLFGSTVASAGDVNGDGFSDVIVGAYSFDNGQTNEGRAFLYHGSATGINSAAATVLEVNQASALFGNSVASAGDVNGDGYSDVIVGAYLFDNGLTDEGAAFLYHGSATGISSTAAVVLEGNQLQAYFGFSVASAGDVNGDGYSDVIVGAYLYDNGQSNEGAAFVYHGSASGINTTATVVVESNQASAFMGYAVAGAGDVNGDGYSDIIVGATQYDNVQTNEGAAFLYHGSATGINTTAASIAESNKSSALMGNFVASAGDVNGDGYSDVIIGAAEYDIGVTDTDEGRAYLYQGSVLGINTSAAIVIESNQAAARLGSSVASAGDVNADGYSDIAIGAPLYTNGETGEGRALVYQGNSGGGLRSNALAFDNDLTNLYTTSSLCDAGFGLALFNKSPMGRVRGAIQVERITQGQVWGSGTKTIGTMADLGIAGINQKLAVNYLPATLTRVRARQIFNPVTAIDGRMYGPWRYLPSDMAQNTNFGFYGGDVIVWDGTNWCKGSGTANAPAADATKRVLIHGNNAVIAEDATAAQFQISGPNTASINPDISLTITGQAKNYNNTAGSFTIKANTIADVGSYIGPAMQNVELQYGVPNAGWHFVSVPFAITAASWQTQNTAGTIALTNVSATQNVQRYNTTLGSGINTGYSVGGYSSSASGQWQLPLGIEVLNASGYNLKIDNSYGGAPQVVKAQGTTQDVAINFPLYSANGGWNMVPNPYPATLDLQSLYTVNSTQIDPGIYIWDAASNNFVAIDASTGLAVHASLGVNTNGRYASAGQAFYVRPTDYNNVAEAANSTVTTTTKTLAITPAMRSTTDARLYKNENIISLKATHGQTQNSDQFALVFDEIYTDGFTKGEDIEKFFAVAEDATSLFVSSANKAMAIAKYQSPVAESTIPVGFSAKQNGVVEISLTDVPDGWSVWLKDYKTGAIKNLGKGSYSFANDQSFGPDRFAITVSKTEQNLMETEGIDETPIAYAANGNLMINMNGTTGEDVQISVLDMAGRVVYTLQQAKAATDISIPFNTTTGLYLVQIENKNSGKIFSQKLFW